jgi:hypothetical protein
MIQVEIAIEKPLFSPLAFPLAEFTQERTVKLNAINLHLRNT